MSLGFSSPRREWLLDCLLSAAKKKKQKNKCHFIQVHILLNLLNVESTVLRLVKNNKTNVNLFKLDP